MLLCRTGPCLDKGQEKISIQFHLVSEPDLTELSVKIHIDYSGASHVHKLGLYILYIIIDITSKELATDRAEQHFFTSKLHAHFGIFLYCKVLH